MIPRKLASSRTSVPETNILVGHYMSAKSALRNFARLLPRLPLGVWVSASHSWRGRFSGPEVLLIWKNAAAPVDGALDRIGHPPQ